MTRKEFTAVLILVLLGYGLVAIHIQSLCSEVWRVLILVLLGYGLVGGAVGCVGVGIGSLNPCFVGIWSCRKKQEKYIPKEITS